MIRRSYSPPFQARAPQPGADDIGKTIKGLVNVEVSRSNEISFAVESFGCDGKPVLSTLRGLSCEVDGKMVMAGTKNGMPFKLGSDLPRGVGSAIRGAGGGMVQVVGGVAMLTREWVLYDNYGNHWSLDQGSTPVYLGETPPLANGDGITPAVCTMDPHIRPYEEWRQWYNDESGEGGGPVDYLIHAWVWAYGWTEDGIGSPVYTETGAVEPIPDPADWRVLQWIPTETTPPDGTGLCGVWPTTNRRAFVSWLPTDEDPHDFDALPGGIGTIVSMYPAVAPYETWLNQFTKPAVEQMSVGGIAGENGLLIRIETNGTTRRIAMRQRSTGVLIDTESGAPSGLIRTDGRQFWTPNKDEGWFAQSGTVGGSSVVLGRYWSRTSTANNYGTAISYRGTTTVTLPSGAAHAWDAEPVWFRVGRVSRSFGNTRITPLLPRW